MDKASVETLLSFFNLKKKHFLPDFTFLHFEMHSMRGTTKSSSEYVKGPWDEAAYINNCVNGSGIIYCQGLCDNAQLCVTEKQLYCRERGCNGANMRRNHICYSGSSGLEYSNHMWLWMSSYSEGLIFITWKISRQSLNDALTGLR